MYKNSELWKMLPTDFSIFNRHNTPYIEYLDLAERKMSRYSELGCEEISNKITEKIKQLRISLRDRYYGFNRVTITVASAILSKMHGYKFRTSYDREDNVTFNVVVSNYFSQHSKEYSYEPKLYSFYELGCQAPKATLRAINHLDSFPDINGKPLFDNYLVLVPSIKYDGSYDSLRNLDMNLIKNRDIVPVLLGERNSKCYFLCYFT
ncbi:MAG: hypothetical protein GTO02_05825 [Candidatus Dadabacteria bacterium]|nr:hypothetical protein [Candidatus Dadabacteria bacterium]